MTMAERLRIHREIEESDRARRVVTFKVVKPFLNDTGAVFTARVVERFANGLRVSMGGDTFPVLYADIQIL